MCPNLNPDPLNHPTSKFCISRHPETKFVWNHILQDFLILIFVIMGFWRIKYLNIILSVLTAILLGIIEYYSLPEWNNIFRASLILIILISIIICSRKINQKYV